MVSCTRYDLIKQMTEWLNLSSHYIQTICSWRADKNDYYHKAQSLRRAANNNDNNSRK